MMKQFVPFLLLLCFYSLSFGQKPTKEQKAHVAAIKESIDGHKLVVSMDTAFFSGKPMAAVRTLTTKTGSTFDIRAQDLAGKTIAFAVAPRPGLTVFTFPELSNQQAFVYGSAGDDRPLFVAIKLFEQDVFTANGFDKSAAERFIAANREKEHGLASLGRDLQTFGSKVATETQAAVADAKNPMVDRDRTQPISVGPVDVRQGGIVIGKIESSAFNNDGIVTTQLSVMFPNGDKAASVRYDNSGKVSIFTPKDNRQQEIMTPAGQEAILVMQYLVNGMYL